MKFGRPAIYETVEQLSQAIENYFDSLETGEGENYVRQSPTVAGLAFALGYQDRQSIYDQKARGNDFSCILKRTILYIESYHERNLIDGKGPTGSIFWLKNHGWTDAQEIKQTGNRDPININFGEMITDSSNQEVFTPE